MIFVLNILSSKQYVLTRGDKSK